MQNIPRRYILSSLWPSVQLVLRCVFNFFFLQHGISSGKLSLDQCDCTVREPEALDVGVLVKKTQICGFDSVSPVRRTLSHDALLSTGSTKLPTICLKVSRIRFSCGMEPMEENVKIQHTRIKKFGLVSHQNYLFAHNLILNL